MWHSNRSVAENVKQIEDGEEDAKKEAPRRKRKAQEDKAKSRAALAAADVLREKPARARRSALPDFVPPQLATLRDNAPNAPDWVHEVKFDGYRMQARLDDGKVKLLTRKALDWTAQVPAGRRRGRQARRRHAR